MLDERLNNDRLAPGALLSAMFVDLTDLIQKEIVLAKTELQQSFKQKLTGSIWLAVACVVLVTALLTCVGGLVFLIASYDVALHWSAFFVAGIAAIIGFIALMVGKKKLNADSAPARSIRQVRANIATVKEQVQ